MDNCDNFNCYSLLNEDDISRLEEKKTRIEFLQNEMIFKQGGLSSHIYLVLSGYVKLHLETAKSKKLNIYIAQKGDFLSLSSLFNSEKYKYSALAVTDVTLCMLDKNAVFDIFSRNHQFLLFIVKSSTEIENRLVDVLHNISHKQMRGKLASALLYLLNKENFNHNISEFITRQDLADFAGITVENTVSLLKELERDKIIELNGKIISICNDKILKELAIKG
jgi:CRP/FNR family transcriptional regulator, polysaccharide utilization system transcription regulator